MGFIETVQSIDFTAVGATNLRVLDIEERLLNEKLSVLIYVDMLKRRSEWEDAVSRGSSYSPNGLRLTEYFHPRSYAHQTVFVVKMGVKDFVAKVDALNMSVDFEEVLTVGLSEHNASVDRSLPSKRVSIRPKAKFQNISIFDATRKNADIPEEERIEELLQYFGIKRGAYAPFKLGSGVDFIRFDDDIETLQHVGKTDFCKKQEILWKLYSFGFPQNYSIYSLIADPYHKYKNDHFLPCRPTTQSDIVLLRKFCSKERQIPSLCFYDPIGPMGYEIRARHELRQTRLYRLFFNPDGCGLREALVPLVFLRKGNMTFPTKSVAPNMELLPLWNIDRIMKNADTVVLCSCIQDAEALQRRNEKIHNVAFTSFVGDSLEQVDFRPLAGKRVVFLTSNHNGISLEDAYDETAKVFEFLKETKIELSDFAFIQRQVDYGYSSSSVGTTGDLAEASRSLPKTDQLSILRPMDEVEFYTMLAKIKKARELPFWARPFEEKPARKNPADNIVVRSLLYRNAITILSGPPEAGKSRFCRSLIRFVVNGSDRVYMKERLWTRCCSGGPIKVLYWLFDSISDLDSWKEICLRGLSEEQKQNIFIEDAPTAIKGFHDESSGKPIVEAYKRRLTSFFYKGTPGHPIDLLIVDTLNCVWNKDNIEASLRFLAMLIKAMPGMAVLAIHHTTIWGLPLGGGSAMRIPRIVLTMEREDRIVPLDGSDTKEGSQPSDPPDSNTEESNADETATKSQQPSKQPPKKKFKKTTEVYKIRYEKFSTSHALVEKLPFYCVREDEDMYSVYDPVCTRDEMFRSLVYHYQERDDGHLSRKMIADILRYSEKVIGEKVIDEDEYFRIYENAKKKAPDDAPPVKKTRGIGKKG